jgi:hypothetical protein
MQLQLCRRQREIVSGIAGAGGVIFWLYAAGAKPGAGWTHGVFSVTKCPAVLPRVIVLMMVPLHC